MSRLCGVGACVFTCLVLAPSIALYRKHGFEAVSEGSHASYARCNVVMELLFAAPA